ncbi:MAG: heterodisulfide reductase subunit A, partial [Desulfobulbaceae bacterium]
SIFIKGKVADINVEDDGAVTVIAENAVTGDKVSQTVDMAILATGMEPSVSEGAPAADLDTNGFVLSDFEKGILGAGCAKKAADVATSTQSSTAAALKAIQVSRR